jgi:hypothetical protein
MMRDKKRAPPVMVEEYTDSVELVPFGDGRSLRLTGRNTKRPLNFKKPKDCQWIDQFKNNKNRGEESFFSAAYIECHLKYSKLVEMVVGKG